MIKFVLKAERLVTPFGTLVAPWTGVFEEGDRADYFLEEATQSNGATVEVAPQRKPKRSARKRTRKTRNRQKGGNK